MNNPDKGSGFYISGKNKAKFEENREILMSIIRHCLESKVVIKKQQYDCSLILLNLNKFFLKRLQ